MSDKPRKFGWQVKGILGIVFTSMGALYAVLGLLLWVFKAGENETDPLVFLCVFGGIGIAFLTAGLILLSMDLRRRRGQRRAYESGRYVMADIVGTQVMTSTQVNGVHPWVVEAHYRDPDTGAVHVCFSRPLRFNPDDLLTARQAPVYLDPLDSRHVFLDIDAVLPDVVMHK